MQSTIVSSIVIHDNNNCMFASSSDLHSQFGERILIRKKYLVYNSHNTSFFGTEKTAHKYTFRSTFPIFQYFPLVHRNLFHANSEKQPTKQRLRLREIISLHSTLSLFAQILI